MPNVLSTVDIVCVCVCAHAHEQSVTQSRMTLCRPMDCSLPGSSISGIVQARILGQVTIFCSRGSSRPRDQTHGVLLLQHWQVDSLPLAPRKPRHFIYQVKVQVAQSCPTLCDPLNCSLPVQSLLCPWNSPGKNTGVGSSSLLQGIFPTQGSNTGLPNCRWILFQLRHQGSCYIWYQI